jgi:thiol-disulfide isomerase/thioredoxin
MNKQRGIAITTFSSIILVVAILGAIGYYVSSQKQKSLEGCRSDGLVCSDGTVVGRSGPNCEFEACPTKDIEAPGHEIKGGGSVGADGAMMNDGGGTAKVGDVVIPSQSDLKLNEDKDDFLEVDENDMANIDRRADGSPIIAPSYIGEVLAGDDAKLLDFNKDDYNTAIDLEQLIVLYFYANWCPSCRTEFPKMQAAFDQIDASNIVGFRVNFNDNQTDGFEEALAREFGVGYQHTKVFLRNGERILKSPEQWTTSRYLEEINSALGI